MKSSGVSDPFSVLQIEPTACRATLRSAFRAQALLFHPDRNPGDPVAEQHFRKVVRAYETAMRLARGDGVWTRSPRNPQAYQAVRPAFRFACGQCGDSFQHPFDCSSCNVPTVDTERGETPEFRETKAVDDMIVRLLMRKPLPAWVSQQSICRTSGLVLASLAATVFFTGLSIPAGFLLVFALMIISTEALGRNPAPVRS